MGSRGCESLTCNSVGETSCPTCGRWACLECIPMHKGTVTCRVCAKPSCSYSRIGSGGIGDLCSTACVVEFRRRALSAADASAPERMDSCARCYEYLGKSLGESCAGCRSVRYCDKDCQRAHWMLTHKTVCKPASKRVCRDNNCGDLAEIECGACGRWVCAPHRAIHGVTRACVVCGKQSCFSARVEQRGRIVGDRIYCSDECFCKFAALSHETDHPKKIYADSDQLKKKEEEGKPAGEHCVVCLDAPPSHVFIPCGHMIICGACSAALKKNECVLCRTPFSQIVKIFK